MEQAQAAHEARQFIRQAKDALTQAAHQD